MMHVSEFARLQRADMTRQDLAKTTMNGGLRINPQGIYRIEMESNGLETWFKALRAYDAPDYVCIATLAAETGLDKADILRFVGALDSDMRRTLAEILVTLSCNGSRQEATENIVWTLNTIWPPRQGE